MSESINKTSEAARLEASLPPPLDVIEDTSGITLHADLPGVPKGRLHQHVEADTLSIEGEVPLKIRAGMESSHAEVCLTLSPCVQPLEGTTHRTGGCRVRQWRAQAPHPQGGVCAAANDRDMRRMNPENRAGAPAIVRGESP